MPFLHFNIFWTSTIKHWGIFMYIRQNKQKHVVTKNTRAPIGCAYTLGARGPLAIISFPHSFSCGMVRGTYKIFINRNRH